MAAPDRRSLSNKSFCPTVGDHMWSNTGRAIAQLCPVQWGRLLHHVSAPDNPVQSAACPTSNELPFLQEHVKLRAQIARHQPAPCFDQPKKKPVVGVISWITIVTIREVAPFLRRERRAQRA